MASRHRLYIVVDCFDIVLRYINAKSDDEAIEIMKRDMPEIEDEVCLFRAEMIKKGWPTRELPKAEERQSCNCRPDKFSQNCEED